MKTIETIDKKAAGWFRWMGAAGLVFSIVIFFLFLTGVLSSDVSPAESAALWTAGSGEYLSETGLLFAPGWFLHPFDGYFLSTAALALLASTALPTLLALSVFWFLHRDYVYGGMALIISGVLIFAIAGW